MLEIGYYVKKISGFCLQLESQIRYCEKFKSSEKGIEMVCQIHSVSYLGELQYSIFCATCLATVIS